MLKIYLLICYFLPPPVPIGFAEARVVCVCLFCVAGALFCPPACTCARIALISEELPANALSSPAKTPEPVAVPNFVCIFDSVMPAALSLLLFF